MGTSWQRVAIQHFFWYLSRVLLSVTLVAVGFFLRDPLNRFLERLKTGDARSARRDEATERVRTMASIYSKGWTAAERLADLAQTANPPSTIPTERNREAMRRQVTAIEAASEDLREALRVREVWLDRGFCDAAIQLALLAESDAHEIFAYATSRRTSVRHFEASVQLARSLALKLENLLVIERAKLLSQAQADFGRQRSGNA